MIEVKNFDGDVSVGRNAVVGGDAKVCGGMTVGKNLKVEGWLDAKNIKGSNKGLFVDEASLKKAYPVPQDGWWALVGDTMPAALWVANGGEWVTNGGTGGEITVESQQIEALIERFEEEMQSMRDVNEAQTNNIVALSNATNTNAAEIEAVKSKNAEQDELLAASVAADAAHDEEISALKSKDTTHDSRIEKLEERVLQYIYPKLYQLNEGAGALKFNGFTEAEGSGGLLLTKDTYRYSVMYSTTQKAFILNVTDEVSGQGVRVGTFNIWPKIEGKGIASSESYAERDNLYYIYVDGEGSTYYYIDSNGVASEKSATYLLRMLANKNASAIDALQGKDAEQDGEIAKLHERDTALDGKISALEAKDIEHNTAIVRNATVEYYDHSVTDGPSRINTRATFKFFGADNNQLFTATLLGAGNGYPGLLSLKNKTKLDGYADTFPQNPAASSESNGLMSAEDKRKLDSVGGVIDLPWDDEVQGQDGYINNFTERGEYHIHGERLYANDGLPILNAASGHTIDGLMTVLDSSLPNGNKYDVCVTQILRLNNRVGGDGHIFVRTGIAANKAELKKHTAGGWSTWEKLMGVFEKNAVSNATDLNEYTSSGMYDGMFVFSSTSQTTVSGLKIESGSTFLMVSVNGYAVAQTGVVPQVTQLLYVMPSGLDGSSGVRNAKLYTRTGIYVASTKTYTWGKFDGLAQASDITKLLGYIQDNSDLIQENQVAIAANTQEIARVSSTAARAQEGAERAQEAANTAQTTADSAQTAAQEAKATATTAQATANAAKSAAETAQTAADTAQGTANSAQTASTEAKTAAQEAKTAAETAQSTATAAQTKNSEQDARLNTAEATINSEKAKFEALKVEFEKVKNSIGVNIYGSVRVSGISDPQLTFRRYIADGAAGNPLDVIHPCLVEKGTGKLLHVLQNLNFEKDINGAPRKIDGSEGEVYITNTEPIYHITGHVYVNGVSYDVFLRSLYPFTWQGKEAEVIEPFGLSPDNCVAHKDDDGVTRMHSVYNPEWAGSYYAMNGFVGKYVYEGIGNAMTDTYDASGALFDGAGGLASVSISLTNGEQYAMNMNEDTTKTVPFFNEHAYALELFIGHMYAEGGTYDAHNAELMGSGFTANDNVTTAAHFNADNELAVNGIRYLGGDGATTRYLGNSSFGQWDVNGKKYHLIGRLTNFTSPWKIMERQRVMAYAIKNNIPELTWFAFDGNKYKWRSVSGFAGPNDGVMTCVVFKVFSTKFAANMVDNTGGASLEGHRIDFMITGAMYRGWSTDVSPGRWDSGLIFTSDNTALYKAYIQRDQSKMIKSIHAIVDAGTVLPFEESYEYIGSVQGPINDYRRDFSDGSLFYTKSTEQSKGGSLHTYIGAHNRYSEKSPDAGFRSVYGFRRGEASGYSFYSPCIAIANYYPSYLNVSIGFGTCVQIANSP